MKNSESGLHKTLPRCSGLLPPGLALMALIIVGLWLLAIPHSYAQETDPYKVILPSGALTPAPGIADSSYQLLSSQLRRSEQPVYIFLQLKRSPTRAEREALAASGVQLVSFINGNTWYAKIEDANILNFQESDDPALRPIRWIGQIRQRDKMGNGLQKIGFAEWALVGTEKVKLSVDFFRDVDKGQAREILAKYNAEIESERSRRTGFDIVLPKAKFQQLLGEPLIRLVENYPPPKTINNNGSRTWTHTDPVHLDGITGEHVIVGIWDAGEVDDSHHDLGTRVTLAETSAPHWHSTHVAGTMAGDGTVNPNRAGHAPGAEEIVSYDMDGSVPDEMGQAIEDYDIDLANNSWNYVVGWWQDDSGTWNFLDNQYFFGNYYLTCGDLDELMRDENLIVVFSAGNNRDNPNDGSETPAQPGDWDQGTGNDGYATISPPSTAKNVITVGAINDATSNMAGFSGWGPTDDGRVKPDLVAPGVSISSTGADDTYTLASGTSMAAPAVSGISALLLQAYREEFYGTADTDEAPLPSTIKSLLIHAAQEMGDPGPDFRFGWGGVDAEAAVELINNRTVVESEFQETGQEDVFYCHVPADATEFDVTIAWDDFRGANLINDLDLTLEAPDATVSLPWILDPSPANWDNAAVTGADHTNNVESVHVDDPDEGWWTIRVTAHAINEPLGAPRQTYSLVSDFPFLQPGNVSVVQAIDRTGSMGTYGYMEPAKAAAQAFIGLMQLGDEIGVVSFDDPGCDGVGDKAEATYNLAALTDEAVRDAAISSISSLYDRGCTSIGAAIQMAQTGASFLAGADPDNPHAIVLLTDGFENTTPYVSTVIGSIPEETDIYTIALGETADADLMQDIAATTGGKFYETPTALGLLGLYYQIQGDLELGAISALYAGVKHGGNDTYPLTVDAGAWQATFALGWLQSDGELDLTLVDPDGKPVNASYSSSETNSGETYHYFRIQNPKAGEWEAHITRTDGGSEPVDYTFATFVKGSEKLWSFIPMLTPAGECLNAKVQLLERNKNPITGATVKAIVTSPRTSNYTLNYQQMLLESAAWYKVAAKWFPNVFRHYHQASWGTKAQPMVSTAAANPASEEPAWAARLRAANQASIDQYGRPIFLYDTQEVILYDDGSHGDDAANDGAYANCIDMAQVAGAYNIRFEVSGVDRGGSPFTRRRLSSSVVEPAVASAAASQLGIFPRTINIVEGQGTEGVITIVPIDQYGNVLGPGLAHEISISTTAGQLSGNLIDNGDGFYFQEIQARGMVERGAITVTVRGVKLDTKPVVIFRNLTAGPRLSLHAGYTVPVGSMSSDYNGGLHLMGDLGYQFNPQFSLMGMLGYNAFQAKDENVTIDTYWINLSLNGKYSRNLSGPWSAHVHAGPGLYIPKKGAAKLGGNIGAALSYDFVPSISLEAGVGLHTVFDADFQYLQNRLGLIFKF